MNVRNSITSEDEKLANKQLKDQWDNINWKEVEELVNRLQIRITKAVKKGKWYLVKRLQHLLTPNKVLEKTKKILQPETETMTKSCCPI